MRSSQWRPAARPDFHPDHERTGGRRLVDPALQHRCAGSREDPHRRTRCNEVKEYADQTVRFLGVNAGSVERAARCIPAIHARPTARRSNGCIRDPEAMKDYAKWAGRTEAIARRVRDEFVLKENAQPDMIEGLDLAMADAITFKYLAKPLTPEQLKEHDPVAGADKVTVPLTRDVVSGLRAI